MKNIFILILVLILIIDSSANAQDILWKKNYGLSTADDIGRSVIETIDGGIAVVGYTGSFGAGGNDVWLIKTNADGDTLWARTYGGSNGDFGYSIKETNDGGFIIGGGTYSYGLGGADFYLIRTNSIGDTLWTKTFGEVNDDFCLSLDITDDGYILAGKKNSNLPFHPDMWIIKTDQLGNQIWEKTYAASADEIAYSIENTNDGGFIIGGTNNSVDGWVLKLDSFGDTIWTKIFEFRVHSIFESIDGYYISTGIIYMGGEDWDIVLAKTDSLGNELWSKTYDYNNEFDIGYSVQQTIDGGYIVCGSGKWDVDYGWIIRTNEFGDTLWTKSVESYSSDNVLSSLATDFYSIIQLSNGDYVATGNQPYLPVSDHAQQLLLMKISSDIVPVELTSFTANVEQNSVSLNWQTATETNNSGFEVQRTSPLPSPYEGEGDETGSSWSIVGFVPGFGTTTEPKSYSFVDENLSSGKYQYRLKQIDFDGRFEYSKTVEVEISAPTEFTLEQNYPNPFNPSTTISFSIPEKSFVTLKVYDMLGREVAELVNEELETGNFEKTFDASSLSSGVYIYRITAMKEGKILFNESKQMLLIK
jgi:hypothetical protein